MIKRIFRYVIMFLLGMCTYGCIQAAIITVKGRVGTFGGEILVVPFMFGLIYMGWFLSEIHHREKLEKNAKEIFHRGFAIGSAETLKSIYEEKKKKQGA